jgi:hypothetical protein
VFFSTASHLSFHRRYQRGAIPALIREIGYFALRRQAGVLYIGLKDIGKWLHLPRIFRIGASFVLRKHVPASALYICLTCSSLHLYWICKITFGNSKS